MTKEEFFTVYNNHKPNAIARLFYKNFGAKATTKVKTVLNTTLILLFISGFVFSAIELRTLALIFTVIFSGLILVYGIFGLIVIISEYIRINKIKKELNITTEEYNKLIS